MKNMKRAYRRHKKEVWIQKRLSKWLQRYSNKEKAKEIAQAKKGESWTFVRTTGKPCSCKICSIFKYRNERSSKSQIKRIIEEDIEL